LKPGTSLLHHEACVDALQPWKETKALTMCGSDFSFQWTGWLEGAVVSGKGASKNIDFYLNPPVTEKNFAKFSVARYNN
jgi:monoamine oxidase